MPEFPKTRHGFIKVMNGILKGTEIDILYFPPEYSIEKSNTFSEISVPGLESPYLQFVKGNAASLSLEVFYDTYPSGIDVRIFTDQLSDLMNIDPMIHAPPQLQFIWGSEDAPFDCVLERVTKKFTMFKSIAGGPENAVPVRARLNIVLKEYKPGLNEREKALQSPDKTKVYIVKEGETLFLIANREYGKPSEWRPIADKNRIYNPRLLAAGTELIIPPLE